VAENWTQAFGRYLRTLRERRGLSLQDVASLSQPFAEQITKGYLSRCENGRVRLALSKATALSHIYKVSAEVLLERIDLDMELDRVGSPDTVGMSRVELRKAGKLAADRGYKWDSYAYLRETVLRSSVEEVGDEYRDRTEQDACAVMSCATAAVGLGRVRFAHHEYQHVQTNELVGPRYLPLVLERLALTYGKLGKLDSARDFSDRAIAAAKEPEGHAYLGYAYSTRARQALAESDLDTAASLFQKCHSVFQEEHLVPECARALSNLAQVYFDLKRYGAARRAIQATEVVLKPAGAHHRHRALARILLGEIDVVEQRDDLAERRWKEAAKIARELNDKTLQFKAEYQLLRQAHRLGNLPVARSIQRRLSKLSNYVPEDTPELHCYRELLVESHAIS